MRDTGRRRIPRKQTLIEDGNFSVQYDARDDLFRTYNKKLGYLSSHKTENEAFSAYDELIKKDKLSRLKF